MEGLKQVKHRMPIITEKATVHATDDKIILQLEYDSTRENLLK